MDKHTKIKKIEALTTESYLELMKSLILKMGYKNIVQLDNNLIATLEGPISDDCHGFIYFSEHLSGNIDSVPLVRKIKLIQEKHAFSTSFMVSSQHITRGFIETFKTKLDKVNLVFLGRDQIIDLIEKYISDYWNHDNIELLDYERNYCTSILQESELKSLKIFSEKYQKLMNIFIEPKIIHFYEDKDTQTPVKKTITIDSIIKDKQPIVLSGEAGMGKSTLLKRIGEIIIKSNSDGEQKNLPVFISTTELFEQNYDIENLLDVKLSSYFDIELKDIYTQYSITLLVDSIDEFELNHQIKVVDDLNRLFDVHSIRYILATRSSEKSISIEALKNHNSYNIARFNNQQIEQFVKKFFFNENGRAEKLLEALRENRIIEKLPITPLSLSLISILYEENDLEIPATITDIYDNFNSLLLGKAMVTSRIEFIDISFKERILSLYALEIMKRKERNPMNLDEFIGFFTNHFTSKTLPLKKGTLEDVLRYLVESTGVIYLKNNTYVTFSHNSFMEYYAAVEIFKHQRNLENLYVNDFFDLNWQNSAIFYAGHSKDMPVFLKAINEKLMSSNQLNDYFSGINGAGYILQALFQTDNKLRKETVDIALEINVRALELFMKLSSDDKMLFKSFKLPIIWLINLMYFYENFNSGTLREPLKLSFEDVIKKYLKSNSTTEGYKALMLALTMNSNRINESKELEKLIFKTQLLDNNILTIISEISLGMMTNGSLVEIKKQVKKEFKKIKAPLRHLLETPAGKLRFSDYDKIASSKRVKIVTEGKTDAMILEHAFMSLQNGNSPYWHIRPSGNESGSAHEVYKTLLSAKGILQEDEILIGIFDHDEAGLSNFNGLSIKLFESIKPNVIKKHKEANIFAIILPIPGDKVNYLMAEQKFNYFEIEHYFPHEFLKENEIYSDTPLTKSQGIYSIKDNKKKALVKIISDSKDPGLFKDFSTLFEEIDLITGINIQYF